MASESPKCPKCGSKRCERFVESDAPLDGVNTLCKECGELFRSIHLRFTYSERIGPYVVDGVVAKK